MYGGSGFNYTAPTTAGPTPSPYVSGTTYMFGDGTFQGRESCLWPNYRKVDSEGACATAVMDFVRAQAKANPGFR